MTYLIGLGNPGTKYQSTRHNLGVIILNQLVIDLGLVWSKASFADAQTIKYHDLLLVKPTTYMNESGSAIKAVWSYYQKESIISPTNFIVIHDELDLPLGEYRIQSNRSGAGHRGVQSIIDAFDGVKDFTRVRVGIGRPDNPISIPDFVLQPFDQTEQQLVNQITQKIIQELKQQYFI